MEFILRVNNKSKRYFNLDKGKTKFFTNDYGTALYGEGPFGRKDEAEIYRSLDKAKKAKLGIIEEAAKEGIELDVHILISKQ